MRKHNKRLVKIILRWLLIGIVLFSCFSFVPLTAKADFIPNGIGVKVGYSGMDLSEYVTVSDYTAAEFESSFEIVEQAYSFFSGTLSTVTDENGNDMYYEYDAIVDSARGVRVADLLNASNINTQDIWNISFYVEDHQEEWSSFDYESLFAGNRYYFNNMSGHRQVHYFTMEDPLTGEEVTDYGTVLGYTFDEVWNDPATCPVEPILAIEDYWESHDQNIDTDIGPNYTSVTTANKYRLLYGQFDPTDSNTRDSAKWVRWVFVTLYGKPSILPSDEDQQLENKVGSYGRVKFEVDDIYNADLNDRLSEYLKIYSSDETVLVITDVETERIPGYDTAAIVYVTYEVVGEGSATIGATFSHNEELVNVLPESQGQIDTVLPESEGDDPETQSDEPEEPFTDEEEIPTKEQTNEGQTSEEEITEPLTEEPTTKADEPATKEEQGGETPTSGGGDKPKTPTQGQDNDHTDQGSTGGGSNNKEADAAADKTENAVSEADLKTAQADKKAEADNTAQANVKAYRLSEDVAAKLAKMENVEVVEVQPQQISDEKIDKLQIEDKSEEKENRRRMILLWTGFGCLGICVVGGVAEYFGFHLRLKHSLSRF